MISGGGGNRRSTLRHAKMLVRHGYGVLLYDPRGSGDSEGTVNSSAGAGRRTPPRRSTSSPSARVEPGRVGVLGLSTGADIAIDIAARRDDVKAVVADGSAAIGYEDIKEYTAKTIDRAAMYVLFKAIEIIQGRSGPKASLADQIARSRAPHLHHLRRQAGEGVGRALRPAGGAHSELWYLPKATHTAALRQYPEAYEQRVVSFFDTNLAGS